MSCDKLSDFFSQTEQARSKVKVRKDVIKIDAYFAKIMVSSSGSVSDTSKLNNPTYR
jgi:hypothetical protein